MYLVSSGMGLAMLVAAPTIWDNFSDGMFNGISIEKHSVSTDSSAMSLKSYMNPSKSELSLNKSYIRTE